MVLCKRVSTCCQKQFMFLMHIYDSIVDKWQMWKRNEFHYSELSGCNIGDKVKKNI